MKPLIRLPIDLLLWAAYLVVLVPLWILGIPICYILARKRAWVERDSPYFKDAAGNPRKLLQWKPAWGWLYGNLEDSIAGPQWWKDRIEGVDLRKEAFLWSAWRNPVNNLRFLPFINPVPDPKRVRWVGNSIDPHVDLAIRRTEVLNMKSPIWCYARQGIYAGFWMIWPWSATRHFRFRIGWKILGKDAVRGIVDDYRRFYFPFAFQLTPWRRG